MHNTIQVGFTLADVLQGSGASPGKGAGTTFAAAPAQAMRALMDTATAQAGGQPVTLTGVEISGPVGEGRFQAVFETLPLTATANAPLTTIAPEPGFASEAEPRPMEGFDPSETSPEDRPFGLMEFLSSIASGDIDIDDVIPPGTALSEKIKAFLANYSEGMDPQSPITLPNPPSTRGHALRDGQDIIQMLQELASSLQPGSAAQAAANRLQIQADAFVPRAQALGLSVQDPARSAPAPSNAAAPILVSPDTPTGERSIQPAAQTPALAQTPTVPAGEKMPQQAPIVPQQTTTPPAQPAAPVSTEAPATMPAFPGEPEHITRGIADDRSERGIATPGDLLRDVTPPRQTLSQAPLLPNATAAAVPRAVDANSVTLAVIESQTADPGLETFAREARLLAPLNTVPQGQPGPMPPAHAHQITRQIAVAIQNNASRSVEITLSPVELGHVRISLSSADAGLVVSIQADRPETLELMRRNAELLASDFRDIGYDGATFSFESSSQQGQAGDEDQGTFQGQRADSALPVPGHPATAEADHGSTRTIILGDGAIDIRL